MKKSVVLLLVGIFIYGVVVFGQDSGQSIVQGVIEEISFEGNYLVVDGKRITVGADFLDDFYLEEGDSVKIIAENSPEGLLVLEYEYLNPDKFDDSENLEEE
jgi:hypothetical protein